MHVLLLVLSLVAFRPASPDVVVTGLVREADTGLPLPGVHIRIDGTSRGAVSDADGRFEISVTPGSTVLISAVGFEQRRIVIPDDADVRLDLGFIRLVPATLRLSEIVVTPGRFSIMGAPLASHQTLSERDIDNMSWAEDVTRVVSRLPGISSSDFSSKFTIRGGEADEVLITLDGMELYEPFHQRDKAGGLSSIVDVEAVQGIDLMTGGFPAEYGNRLSGVFAMRTRSPEQRRSIIGLSMMNARAYTEGSFSDGKGSYLVSARRGMLDLLFKLVPDAELVPTFYDGLFKVEYRLGENNTIAASGLLAVDHALVDDLDELGAGDRNETRYDNAYGWVTLRSWLRDDLVARSIAYSGRVHHDRDGFFIKYEPSDKGDFSLQDVRTYTYVGLKQDWQWMPMDRFAIVAGFDVRKSTADYQYDIDQEELRVDGDSNLFTYTRNENIALNPSGAQVGVYLSPRFRLGSRVVIEPGVRYDRTGYSEDEDVSPRIGAALALSDRTHVRAAYGLFYQPQLATSLDVNNGQLDFQPSQRAEHVVLGIEHATRNGINVRVEAYTKDLSRTGSYFTNLRDHQEIHPEQRNDNAEIVTGGARSQGIEVLLKRDQGGKLSWWLSYALARAEDNITAINFDGPLERRLGWQPRLNNQRHTLNADVNYRPSDAWTFNFSFQFYNGWPRTDYTYEYLTLDNGDYHFYPVEGAFNATPYPAFHRADVRVNRRFKVRRGEVTTFLHIINLYNRQNLRKFDLDTRDDDDNFSLDEQGNYVPFSDDLNWFGLTPVVGVSWTL